MSLQFIMLRCCAQGVAFGVLRYLNPVGCNPYRQARHIVPLNKIHNPFWSTQASNHLSATAVLVGVSLNGLNLYDPCSISDSMANMIGGKYSIGRFCPIMFAQGFYIHFPLLWPVTHLYAPPSLKPYAPLFGVGYPS
jgi:hypothetical protein